jgi:hypothetical protein
MRDIGAGRRSEGPALIPAVLANVGDGRAGLCGSSAGRVGCNAKRCRPVPSVGYSPLCCHKLKRFKVDVRIQVVRLWDALNPRSPLAVQRCLSDRKGGGEQLCESERHESRQGLTLAPVSITTERSSLADAAPQSVAACGSDRVVALRARDRGSAMSGDLCAQLAAMPHEQIGGADQFRTIHSGLPVLYSGCQC